MNPQPFGCTLLLACAVLLVGCVSESDQAEPKVALPEELTDVAMSRLKRIRDADPLAVGRVITLFDFEAPSQVESFRKFGEASYDVRHISTAKAATGLSSLQIRLTAEHPLLTTVRGVPTDWREYRLLRMEVFSETVQDGFFVRLRDDGGRGTDYGPFRLRIGWQPIVVELDRVAALVDLERIAQFAVTMRGVTEPASLWLDDVILIDNRAVRWPVYGNDRTVGYRLSGRKLSVFGPAGFEVSFAPDDGGVYRLREWTALAGRRRRMRSAPRAPLLTIDPIVDLASLGRHRLADCRVIEMNRVRVRVRLRRLYFDRFAQIADGTAASITETYTIYGSGQIYVLHEADLGEAKVDRVSLRLRTSEVLRPQSPGPPADGSPMWTAHVDQRRGREAAVLLVLGPTARKATLTQSRWAGRLSLSQIDLPAPATAKLAVRLPLMLNVKPPAGGAIADALADYMKPLEMVFTRGRAALTDPGDADQDGFNETEGCHVIRAEEGILRFTLRPRRGARQSPVFKILNMEAENFLVNVGGRVTEVIARDSGGAALAQIPGRIDRNVSVEITPATGTRHPVLPEVW